MKRAFICILIALTAATAGVFGIRLLVTTIAPIVPRSLPVAIPAGLTTTQEKFLTLCSGLVVIDANARVAVANCLGRLRGFSDGHMLTVQLAKVDPTIKVNVQLWCVGSDVSDKQLLDSVIIWATENAERFDQLLSEYNHVNAATAVMIAAFHSKFPCEK